MGGLWWINVCRGDFSTFIWHFCGQNLFVGERKTLQVNNKNCIVVTSLPTSSTSVGRYRRHRLIDIDDVDLWVITAGNFLFPHMRAFAAGVMFYVVIEELIPEVSSGQHSNLSTIGFAIGFVLMMTLDVIMG